MPPGILRRGCTRWLGGSGVTSSANSLQKLPALLSVVQKINVRFGGAVRVLDHWEADVCAVGFTRTGTDQPLVYLSTEDGQRFYVELEVAVEDAAYRSIGSFDGIPLERVVQLMESHLMARKG